MFLLLSMFSRSPAWKSAEIHPQSFVDAAGEPQPAQSDLFNISFQPRNSALGYPSSRSTGTSPKVPHLCIRQPLAQSVALASRFSQPA